MFRVSDVRKFSIRRWSPMRCIRSPIIFVSKKLMGNFISFIKKSDISEIFMRVLMCRSIQPRIKSVDIRAINSTICATNTKYTKFRFWVFMPTSTTLWVRNGKISCNRLPNNMPNANCTKNFLCGRRYFSKNENEVRFCPSPSDS